MEEKVKCQNCGTEAIYCDNEENIQYWFCSTCQKPVIEKVENWTTVDMGGKEIWGLVHGLETKVSELNERIDRLVNAIDKSQRVKGI